MADDFKIGAGIELNGSKEFSDAIKGINKDLTVLGSEMKRVTAEFADNSNSMEALTAKQDVLSRQVNDQTLKVNTLKAALENAKNEYGDNSDQVQEWQIKLNNAEAALSKTESQLKQTTSQINNFGKEANTAGNEIEKTAEKSGLLQKIFAGGFLANIASNALSTVVGWVKSLASAAMKTVDELKSLSSVTGFTAKELQKMTYIGDDLGVTLDTQSSALKKLINNMSSAQAGTGAAYEAFKKLNVEYEDGNGALLDSNDVYGRVIDALGKMTNETERDAAAQDLLGKSATELNPLIEAGSAALNELGTKAEKAGAIMSEDAVEALDATGDALDHAKQRAQAFVGEALAKIIDSGKTAAETMSDLEESLAESGNTQSLIDKYRTLSAEIGDTSLTSEEMTEKTEELEKAKKDLVTASKGVITSTNNENGTFDKQVGVLETLTQAEKEYTKLRLESTMLKNAGAEAEQKLTEATEKQAAAQARVAEYQTKVNDLTAQGADPDRIDRWAAGLDWATQALATADAELAQVGLDSAAAQEAARMLVDSGFAPASEVAALLGMSVDQLNTYLSATPASTATAIPEITNMAAAIDALNAEYEAAYDSARQSLDGQVGLWDSMEATATTSAADVNAALQSQIDYFTNYRENLDALASRKIPGVDTSELIQSLSDGTTESAAILAGLATATDEQIKQVANNMKLSDSAKDSLASDMAKVKTNYDERWNDIVNSTAESVKKLDKADAARQSGINTLQGYINGVNSKSAALNLTMSNAAQAAMAAWRAALDEHSPSRKMMKSGENAIKGGIIGVENMQDKLNQTFSDTAVSAVSTFQEQMSRMQGALKSSISADFSRAINSVALQINAPKVSERPSDSFDSYTKKAIEGGINGMAALLGGSQSISSPIVFQTFLDGNMVAQSVYDPLQGIVKQKGAAKN